MDLREYAIQSMERVRQNTLNMIKGLTAAQLKWQPGPEANNIAFLLFHTFRVDDWYFNRWVAGGQELWEREGWPKRWRLPTPHEQASSAFSTGHSWTPQQVASWVPPPLGEMLEYATAVRKSAIEVIRTLELNRLQEQPRPDRPEWTVANYLQNGTIHEAQHQAQIDFILGLMKTAGVR
jgi:uncharacterized damage-inducible protein DinB